MEGVRRNMKELVKYLSSLRGDIFKLLPMKEDEQAGRDNHVSEYLDALLINMSGALVTYPMLGSQKQYLYVLNNLQYIHKNNVSFDRWRKIILGSGKDIDNLYVYYGGAKRAK